MNQHAIERLWEKSKNPEFIHFLEVLFPRWMSFLPTGIRYEGATRCGDELVDAWFQAGKELVTKAEELGVTLDGYPRGGLEYRTPERIAMKYCTSTTLRKLRNSWKDNMRTLGLDSSDPTWRVTNHETVHWKNEWSFFQDIVRSIYGAEMEVGHA